MTPFIDGELMGGDFKANLGGLDHYRRFGYKGLNYLIAHYLVILRLTAFVC